MTAVLKTNDSGTLNSNQFPSAFLTIYADVSPAKNIPIDPIPIHNNCVSALAFLISNIAELVFNFPFF